MMADKQAVNWEEVGPQLVRAAEKAAAFLTSHAIVGKEADAVFYALRDALAKVTGGKS
jgi:hypothetical protein